MPKNRSTFVPSQFATQRLSERFNEDPAADRDGQVLMWLVGVHSPETTNLTNSGHRPALAEASGVF
jgi:hypothetical protein